jgi:hypothetical protein
MRKDQSLIEFDFPRMVGFGYERQRTRRRADAIKPWRHRPGISNLKGPTGA